MGGPFCLATNNCRRLQAGVAWSRAITAATNIQDGDQPSFQRYHTDRIDPFMRREQIPVSHHHDERETTDTK